MKRHFLPGLTILTSFLVSCSAPPEEGKPERKPVVLPEPAGMPEGMRVYLVKNYFPGKDAHDPAIDAAVERILTPRAVLDQIAALPWEKGQLEKFGESLQFFAIVRCPDGVHSIHFRGELPRSNRPLTAVRERILRRMYSEEAITAEPAPEIAGWLGREVNVAEAIEKARAAALPLDEAVVGRAKKNIKAIGTKSAELARALMALSESDPAPELCRAALWLVSRLDTGAFLRLKPDESGMDPETSVKDLAAIDARLFYENVVYAVKTREFPWAAKVTDHDFLNYVLSPRGTNEPLQRWRRLVYEALAPEVKDLSVDDAIRLAREAAYDFFQYEGDTTWEDFGPLTALAVHEGRCEDCTNVENMMLRAVGIPGAQAFTPFWGHGDGNHAWSWVPGFQQPGGEGGGAIKVFVKTWDGLEDVTDRNTEVATVEREVKGTGEAELCVWNMEEWRRVAHVPIVDGRARFEKVGCRREVTLAVRAAGEAGKEKAFVIKAGGKIEELETGPLARSGLVEIVMDGTSIAGGLWPGSIYALSVWTAFGWQRLASGRSPSLEPTVWVEPGRLYRLSGEGLGRRIFIVQAGERGEAQILTR